MNLLFKSNSPKSPNEHALVLGSGLLGANVANMDVK